MDKMQSWTHIITVLAAAKFTKNEILFYFYLSKNKFAQNKLTNLNW